MFQIPQGISNQSIVHSIRQPCIKMNKISAEEIKRHQAQHQRILDLEQAIKDTAPIFDTKSLNFLTGEDDRVRGIDVRDLDKYTQAVALEHWDPNAAPEEYNEPWDGKSAPITVLPEWVELMKEETVKRARKSIQKSKISLTPKEEEKESTEEIPHLEWEEVTVSDPYDEEESSFSKKRGFQLALNVTDTSTESPATPGSAPPFRVSLDGTFKMENIHISPDGVRSSPQDSKEPRKGLDPKDLIYLIDLGRGMCGTVRLAWHSSSQKLVAVKSIGVFAPNQRNQVIKEIGVFDAITGPRLVTFFGAFYQRGHIMLTLEYMNRGSLDTIIREGGPFNEDQLAVLAHDIINALHSLHKQHHVHRDIKPANILMNHRGEFKISDFGISRQLDSSRAKAFTNIGTRVYMSPERIEQLEYSYPSDVWSLGITLLFAATGKSPYEEASKSGGLVLENAIMKEPIPTAPEPFSPRFFFFVDQCLQRKPRDRTPASILINHGLIRNLKRIPPAPPYSEHLELSRDEKKFVSEIAQNLKSDQEIDIKNVSEQLGVTHALIEPIFEAAHPGRSFKSIKAHIINSHEVVEKSQDISKGAFWKALKELDDF